MADLRERVYSRLVPCPDPGCECLLWTGCCNSAGYGKVSVGGRIKYVHRVVWELERGAIPDALPLDHVKDRGCVHRNCANLAHLEPVTQRENTLRGEAPAARNAAKTHCRNGHEYTEANTYIGPTDGKRYCRACSQARYLARRDPSQGPLGWRTGWQTRSRLTPS